MLHTRDAISLRGGRRVFHSAVLAALTMAAMLLCLLAVHSAGAGHGLGHGPGHSLSSASTGTAAPISAPTAMTAGSHSAAAHAASSAGAAVVALAAAVSSADIQVMSGLAALSMTCSMLMVLSGLLLLFRRPSSCRCLLEAGGFIVGSVREIPLHLHRPSLTLLSISRI
ncbi:MULTISPECIES: hypothetical protein [Cryobacterium]|uniref:Uncharacterized protein n=1 Tax=Cryobacterium breve TaxID=1259258 RepID=A0ABY2IVY2_9MICO|nr:MULTISPECIES: hypothetical protein [Cryobacterium]TFC93099.1 hypothetical protein E3T20_10775 [Cryobacterium sp. TmT3-12]TFC96084.1 hypothetical protein E3O65_13645 [Cryobacterium breve]